MYLNDKRCAEIVYLGMTVLAVIIGGITCENPNELESLALQAVKEPTEGMDIKRRQKIERRAIWMTMATIKRESDKAHGEKVLLATYLMIEKMITSGYLQMPENSPLARVVDFLLSLVDPDNEITQKRLKKAEKTANDWIDILQHEGYFKFST